MSGVMTSVGRNTRARRQQAEAGFSLLEFLVSSSVTLVVMGLGLSLLSQGQAMFASQGAALKSQSQARKTLNLMTSDLRATGCAPVTITAGTTPGLISASATSIRIVGDRKGNGTTNVVSEDDVNDDVTYSQVNSYITRYAPNDAAYQNTAATLTDQVKSLSFRYFDKNGTELIPPAGGSLDAANRANVVRIHVTLAIDIVETGKAAKTLTMESPVTLRNKVLDGY
jgi:type II secretory pathway pseudopilin PulG